MDRHRDGQMDIIGMDGCRDGQTDTGMDGYGDRQTDTGMDGCRDGQTAQGWMGMGTDRHHRDGWE